MSVDGHISAVDYPASVSFGGLAAHEGISFAPAKRVGRAPGRRRWGSLADFDPKNRGRFQTEAVLPHFWRPESASADAGSHRPNISRGSNHVRRDEGSREVLPGGSPAHEPFPDSRAAAKSGNRSRDGCHPSAHSSVRLRCSSRVLSLRSLLFGRRGVCVHSQSRPRVLRGTPGISSWWAPKPVIRRSNTDGSTRDRRFRQHRPPPYRK